MRWNYGIKICDGRILLIMDNPYIFTAGFLISFTLFIILICYIMIKAVRVREKAVEDYRSRKSEEAKKYEFVINSTSTLDTIKSEKDEHTKTFETIQDLLDLYEDISSIKKDNCLIIKKAKHSNQYMIELYDKYDKKALEKAGYNPKNINKILTGKLKLSEHENNFYSQIYNILYNSRDMTEEESKNYEKAKLKMFKKTGRNFTDKITDLSDKIKFNDGWDE